MTRNDFLRAVLGAAGAAVLVACGGDDGGGADAAVTARSCDSPATTIGTNHGHTMTVTVADVNATANKMYVLAGSAGHTHEVTLTVDHFRALKEGETVMVTSTDSGTGHTHTITVVCPS